MLKDFERENGVKALAGAGQRRDIGRAVIDRKAGRFGMGTRRGDRLRVGVDAVDGKAQPCHRLGDETAAAANIGKAEAGEGRE